MEISKSNLDTKFIGEEIAIASNHNKTEKELIEEYVEAETKLTDTRESDGI